MASYYLSPLSTFLQVLADVGNVPLSGGLIWTYLAGTTTPVATYTDSTGITPNSNPIQLSTAGRLNNVLIWQQAGVPLKFLFSTNAGTTGSPVFGTQIGPTFDQVSGIDDPAAVLSTLQSASGIPSAGNPQGAFLIANAVGSWATLTQLRASFAPANYPGSISYPLTMVEGGAAVGDGAGGIFYWNASSTATDDGVTVIKLTGVATGRYLRYFPTTSGSFTGTFTGMAFTTTGTVQWTIVGNMVVLTIESGASNTSNANTFTMTGLPVFLQTATRAPLVPIAQGAVEDNSGFTGFTAGALFAAGSGTITFLKNGSASGWTNSGVKGFTNGIDAVLVYPLT